MIRITKGLIHSSVGIAVMCGILAVPARAWAQGGGWQVDLAPLYLWAPSMDGQVSLANQDVPFFMSFDDAKDKLAGAFSVHVEARKGRWGLLADVNFVRMSTEASFTTPILANPVIGQADLGSMIVEVGALYELNTARRFSLLGGLRTYTLSPKVEFEGVSGLIEPIDTSETSYDVFGGFMFRPQISEKWMFMSRADIGGGDASFTWSAMAGFQYRYKPWGGLVFGYRALGIDTGDVREPQAVPVGALETRYDVTQYGPVIAATFHWGRR